MELLATRIRSLHMSDVELDLWYFFRSHKLRSIQIRRAPEDYYEWTLERRRDFLQAPSTFYLCKTIVLENTAWNPLFSDEDAYWKYVAVVIQYESKLSSEKVMKFAKEFQNSNSNQKIISKKHFHYRLADEEIANQLTGYGYNAVTPFLMKTELPILLSKEILHLNPEYLFLGGGEVDLKLGISVNEFLTTTKAMVADITS